MEAREIGWLLVQADPDIKHYYSTKTDENYTVWAEYRRPNEAVDDRQDLGWLVQIDRYTRIEYDPVAEAIEKLLFDNEITYSYQVDYLQEEGLIHHIFDCRFAEGS